ncbi:RNA recognition motif domain-containing protein [Chloroflexota bacterium]
MKIYVGNLSYDVDGDELRKEFEAYGEVASISLPTDRYSGKPRGFGFVEMPTVSEGQNAIKNLNGKMLKDRELRVNPAQSPSDNKGRYGKQKW